MTYSGWFLRDLLNVKKIGSLGELQSGLVSVPITIYQNDLKYKGAFASGIAGIKVDETKEVPTVQAMHGWALFKDDQPEH